MVKRVKPEILNRDSWEVITFKDAKDSLVGAVELDAEVEQHLVFITSDAQLLHFPAAQVTPQGRAGGGVAGIKLSARAAVLFFGAVTVDSGQVVTIATVTMRCPGPGNRRSRSPRSPNTRPRAAPPPVFAAIAS